MHRPQFFQQACKESGWWTPWSYLSTDFWNFCFPLSALSFSWLNKLGYFISICRFGQPSKTYCVYDNSLLWVFSIPFINKIDLISKVSRSIIMPIYEFRCLDCEKFIELLIINPDEENELKCPDCNSQKLERVLSTTNYSIGTGIGTRPKGTVQT